MATKYDVNSEQDMEPDADEIEVDDDEVSASETEKSQPLEDFNIASRQKLREELSQQIEAFLARGGKINEVTNPVTNTRPSKPANEYSGRLM